MSKVTVLVELPSSVALDVREQAVMACLLLRASMNAAAEYDDTALLLSCVLGRDVDELAVADYLQAMEEADRIDGDPYEWAVVQWPSDDMPRREYMIEWALDRATEYVKDAAAALRRILGVDK